LKSVSLSFTNRQGQPFVRKGEFVLTQTGVEGSLIYAASSHLRDELEQHGAATFYLNLRPELSAERVLAEVSHPRGARSLSSHLKSRLNLSSVHTALLYELLDQQTLQDSALLARALQHLPIQLHAHRPLDEAISSAGGIRQEAMTPHLMLRALPGVFSAGEMLNWEAPTGGYLLSACLASGRAAAHGVLQHVAPERTMM
jgi:predicted flavoprotein YhiN